MAKSAQEYIDELYNKGMGTVNSSRDQRVQNDNQLINDIQAAIDKTTAASTKPYETQMEQLPDTYRKLFDANAVQELVGRRQVQEAMANMGLTDSGLNRTQQTALSVQRGNADAAARLEQQQKTQELQDQIAALIASGEAQKQQQAASIRNNTANWYNDSLNTLYNNSMQLGTNQYNLETEREIEARRWAEQQEQARLDREAQLEAKRLDAQAAQAQAEAQAKQQDYDNKMALAKLYIDSGMDAAEVISRVFGLSVPSSVGGTGSSTGNGGYNAGAISATSSKYQGYPSPMSFAGAVKKDLEAGLINDYEAVNAIIELYPGDLSKQRQLANMIEVSEAFADALKPR